MTAQNIAILVICHDSVHYKRHLHKQALRPAEAVDLPAQDVDGLMQQQSEFALATFPLRHTGACTAASNYAYRK
jgi:hypothetical protein